MNKMPTRLIGLNILLLILLLGISAPAAMAQAPNAVIEEAMELLASKVENRREELAADEAALYALVNEILLPRFDRRYAAQLVLGRSWRDANDTQRERFIEAFYSSMVHKYADGVLEFDKDRIRVLSFRGDDTKPRVVVKTIVTLEDSTKVPVDYGLVHRESGWLMFDVTIEGISYVRNFRAEINAEIKSSSLDSVIARLEREMGVDT